jgi:DNA ligase 1
VAVSLPTLYARTNTGAIQQWTVIVEDDKFCTTFGQVNGKQQTTEWTVAKPTNEGRANARNEFEQARFEAEALWKKKKDSGYFTSISDVDSFTFVEPMLAKNFDDYSKKISYPVFSQPKLDGIRCIASKNGLFTRNGKPIPSCPHILEQLQSLFEKNPNLVFDGELYNHDLKHDFNKITSLVKKTKPTEEDLKESSKLIQYWIYDVVDTTKTFKERINIVESLVYSNKTLQVVPTGLAASEEDLDKLYAASMDYGFEGQMVRLDTKYENKRSKNLLKRKEFQDSEYTILDVIEGEGNKTGMAGAMLFKNELGIEFNSNIKGDRDYLKEIWANKNDYIGKEATVKYFNLTPDNKLPRFPYVIAIRNYE